MQELLDGLELTEIRTYLLHAERAAHDASQEAKIFVEAKQEGTFVEARARLTVTSEDYELTVDRSAIFTLREALAVEAALLGEFVEKVGIMTVYPYLREGAFTLGMNLGVSAPVMGLMRAGSVKLTIDAVN